MIKDILLNIIKVLKDISRLLVKTTPIDNHISIINEPIKDMETNQHKLLKYSLEALDTDVTPKDNVPDEVACAEVVSTLIKQVFPDFPIIQSTSELFSKLKTDKRFRAVLSSERGQVIVSPRTSTIFGHCGIFITDERIASNNSAGNLKGKFTGNYSFGSWISTFGANGRGLHSYLFNLLD